MKVYTDLEQSKKLAEFLPLDSADMWYWEFPNAPTYNDYGYPMFHKGEGIRNIPCWSLAALLNITCMVVGRVIDSDIWICASYKLNLSLYADNPIDAAFDMILRLHDQNLL